MSLLIFTQPDVFQIPQPATVAESFSSTSQGRVKLQGSYWRARSLHPDPERIFHEHQTIIVIGRVGLTLFIQPYPGSSE